MHTEVTPQVEALLDQAETLRNKGQLEEATHIARQAQALALQANGTPHSLYLEATLALALLHHESREFALSELMYRQALAYLTPQTPLYAVTLLDLAMLYEDQDDLERAEPIYTQTLDHTAGNKALQVTVLVALARLYARQERDAAAAKRYQQALELLDPESSYYLATLKECAELHAAGGDTEHAMALYSEALHHPAVDAALKSTLQMHLGTVYLTCGEAAVAETHLRTAIAGMGEDHTDLPNAVTQLAELCSRTERFDEAEALLRRAIVVQEETIGRDHPAVAGNLYNLALFLVERRRALEAMPLLERGLDLADRENAVLLVDVPASQRDVHLDRMQQELAFVFDLTLRELPASTDAAQIVLEVVRRRKALGLRELDPDRQLFAEWYRQVSESETDAPDETQAQVIAKAFHSASLRAVARHIPEPTGVLHTYVRLALPTHTQNPRDAADAPLRYVALLGQDSDPETVHLIDLGDADPIDRMIAQDCLLLAQHRASQDPLVLAGLDVDAGPVTVQ